MGGHSIRKFKQHKYINCNGGGSVFVCEGIVRVEEMVMGCVESSVWVDAGRTPDTRGCGTGGVVVPPIRTILGASTFPRPELSLALASCSALALSSRLGLSFHVKQSND